MKGITFRKEEATQSLLTDDNMWHPKDFTNQLKMNKFSKLTGYKNQYTKTSYISLRMKKDKLMEQFHLSLHQKE